MNVSVSRLVRAERSWLFLSIGIATSIAILTLMPPATMPKGPQGVDKVYHALAFAGLVLPTALLRPSRLWLILPLAIAYGGLIEVIQPYVGRSYALTDLAADGAGAMLGAMVGVALRKPLLTIATSRDR